MTDAREQPLFKDNLAVAELDVVAYLGFPLATTDGHILGSFCVIDSKPRMWTEDDANIVRDLAAVVMSEIQLRSEIVCRHEAEGERDDLTGTNARLLAEIAARQQAEDQQRELEDQLNQTRKIELIGQLAGGIAHDLNNLLTPILILTSILLDDKELGKAHLNIVDQIQDAGLRSRDLVQQLLTFSQLRALELGVHDLNEIVGNVQPLLRSTLPEDIELISKLHNEALPILADAGQVDQIIMNLVVNAADAMPNGGELCIETSTTILEPHQLATNPEAEPGPFACITVRDTGQGMSAETLERMYEPFFTTKDVDGNGLGLATVLGIVAQHDGVIVGSSTIDEGTCFDVFLPMTEEVVSLETADPSTNGTVPNGRTILMAEDDEPLRILLEKILESNGYQVIAAENGEKALQLLRYHNGPIHLLLTDVVMPGMNGRVLYETACQDRPSLRVLYMSGHSEDIITTRGVLDSGINFIAKPFMPDELVAKIGEAMAQVGAAVS